MVEMEKILEEVRVALEKKKAFLKKLKHEENNLATAKKRLLDLKKQKADVITNTNAILGKYMMDLTSSEFERLQNEVRRLEEHYQEDGRRKKKNHLPRERQSTIREMRNRRRHILRLRKVMSAQATSPIKERGRLQLFIAEKSKGETMNTIILSGRAADDPRKHLTANGKSVVHFSLAVPKKYNRSEADFFRIEAWNRIADSIDSYVKKGNRLNIQGYLAKENFEADGVKREIVKVVVEQIEFLTPKPKEKFEERNYDAERALYEDADSYGVPEEEIPF